MFGWNQWLILACFSFLRRPWEVAQVILLTDLVKQIKNKWKIILKTKLKLIIKRPTIELVLLSVLRTGFIWPLQFVKLCLRVGFVRIRIRIIIFVPVEKIQVKCFDSGENKSTAEALCVLKRETITAANKNLTMLIVRRDRLLGLVDLVSCTSTRILTDLSSI